MYTATPLPCSSSSSGALALKPGAKRKELLDAMRRHVLAQGDLVCIFQKPAPAARKWVARSR